MSKKYFFFGAGPKPDDGHKRVTKFDNGVTVGGTEEQHEKMIDVGIEINKVIAKKSYKGDDYIKEAVQEIIDDARGN